MRIKQILAGAIIGLVLASLCSYLVFNWLYKDVFKGDFLSYFQSKQMIAMLAPCFKLGIIPNAGLFFLLLKLNKDEIARGVLAITILMIVSLFLIIL